MRARLAALSDICDFNPRLPSTLKDDEIAAFIPMAAVSENGNIAFEEERPVREVRKGYSYFERGDVLVAKITPCFENGKATRTSALTKSRGFGSTEFHVLRAGEEIDPDYLFHLLWNDKFRAVASNNMTGSAGQKRVPADFLKRLSVPLPPLDEQRRIAAILDKADALRRKRKRALDLLDGLPQSIFEEMFGDPRLNPKGQRLGKIADLLESTQYGSSEKAGNIGSYPILRMGNITVCGNIDTRDLKFIDLAAKDIEKYTLQKGDIIFNRTNSADLVGKTAVFNRAKPYAFAGYLVRARSKVGVSPYYISAYLNSRHGKATLRGMAKSIVGMANINAKEMQNIEIMIPSSQEQQAYEGVVSLIHRRRDALVAHLQSVESLFTSIQSRAFSGQL